MSEPRTVLEHLLGSRDALVLEVQRLAVAIAELDSVIVRIAGEGRRPAPLQLLGADAMVETEPTVNEPVVPEHVDPQVEVEPEQPEGIPSARRTAATTATREAVRTPGTKAPAKKAPAKKAPAKKALARKAPAKNAARPVAGAPTKAPDKTATAGTAPAPQKSIRVRVLEMLATEDRDFGLAEIIDRIHDEGIQAHDDAVRSITIKLMKDGKIERPSRGLYRLARRGRAATSKGATASNGASTPTNGADAAASMPSTPTPTPTPEPAWEEPSPPEPAPPAPAPAPSTGYTPPLNLGQPWDRRS